MTALSSFVSKSERFTFHISALVSIRYGTEVLCLRYSTAAVINIQVFILSFVALCVLSGKSIYSILPTKLRKNHVLLRS